MAKPTFEIEPIFFISHFVPKVSSLLIETLTSARIDPSSILQSLTPK